ncbi:unnamed protein product, partial [Tenebrio molitor]
KIQADPDRYPQWKIEDDLIYKYIPARIPFEANVREWKLYVPAEQRQQVLLECHDHPTASHFGIFKTTHRSVGTAIRSYVQSHDTWDGEIQKIQQAINTARHEITGYT